MEKTHDFMNLNFIEGVLTKFDFDKKKNLLIECLAVSW